MKEELDLIWCIWDGAEPTDYILCNGDIDVLPKLYQQDNIRFQYNQWNQSWSVVSCTIFMAMWMLADLVNKDFSLSNLKEVDNLSYDYWRTKGKWWWTKSAIDLACKWWNGNNKEKIAYYRVSKYSDVDVILEKNYTMWTNYCPTVEYAKDYYLDWVLDWYEFWTKTNWHAVSFIWDNVRKIKDNYKGRKNPDWLDVNVYEVKNPVSKLTNFSPRLYVYTKVAEDNLEEIKRLNELKSKVLIAISTNSEMWHLVNDKTYKDKLHSMNEANRSKLNDIDIQLRKLA